MSACRWQRRLAVRHIAGFLEQHGSAHDKLTKMICVFISVDVNTKQKNIPPSTRSIKIILFQECDVHLRSPFAFRDNRAGDPEG